MAKINVTQGTAGAYGAGELQLENKVQMTATLTPVTDNLNTASPLKLSTSLVQTTSTLKITTSDVAYIDAEDNSGNNRFTVSRASASQLVTVDFASLPTDLTTPVGAIRTATDGVNLANVMTFLENGKVGIGTSAPTKPLEVRGDVLIQNVSGTDGMLQVGVNGGGISLVSGNRSDITLKSNAIITSRVTGMTIRTTLGEPITATLGVVGSGSTSATTSLLVQNSAGTPSLQITDDGSVFNYGKGGQTANTAFGVSALETNTSGNNNTAFGIFALRQNTTGGSNTAVGKGALYLNFTGSFNTAVGQDALNANSSSSNSALGYATDSNTFSGCLILGREAKATASNQFVVGSSATNAGSVVAEVNTSTNVWNVVINGVARKILLA